jgi:hypothetical protein
MRGSDGVTGSVCSYVDLEKRVRGSPVAGNPGHRERDPDLRVGGIRRSLLTVRTGIDPTQATTSRAAVARVLFDPFGTPTG